MHKRAVQLTVLVLAAIGLTFLFSACGGSTPSATSASEWITAAEGGTVSVDGVATVVIPPGSLTGDTTVTIIKATNGGTVPTELDGADAVGQAFSIDIGGQSLSGPITLEIPFDASALPDGVARALVFLAFYDAEKGEWIPAGGQVDADRGVIIIETDHLSWWNPFTWNWDAWIAVLKKTLSLNISDFVEAVALLTTECVESGAEVIVYNSAGDSVIKGCVDDNGDLRVINLKSFHVAVGISPPPSDPAFPKKQILPPGGTMAFPPLNAGYTSAATAYATFSDESMQTFLVSLVLRMLPGGDLAPNEGLAFIADGLERVVAATEISEDLAAGDSFGAAEGIVKAITGESFIEAFAELARQYGLENGVDMMTKWTKAGIQKTLLGVAAVDVIISATDFLANYFFNHDTLVSFQATDYVSPLDPGGAPEPGSSPTTGDTEVAIAGEVAIDECRSLMADLGFTEVDGGVLEYDSMRALVQVRDYVVDEVDQEEITRADMANGIDWKADVGISSLQRELRPSGEWGEWENHFAVVKVYRQNNMWHAEGYTLGC